MNPDYCNCNDFEKAVNDNDIKYYRHEDDRFNAVKKFVSCVKVHKSKRSLKTTKSTLSPA
jgi:hypothetical protein